MEMIEKYVFTNLGFKIHLKEYSALVVSIVDVSSF